MGKPFENNDINVADCTALAYDGAKVMGSEISRAAIFIKKQPLAQYTHDINQSWYQSCNKFCSYKQINPKVRG